MTIRPKVLAYYFPSWHVDTRNESWFGEGWTEWELLRSAPARFDGHRQPRVPALGYQDDSDPRTFDSQIPLATQHGIDGFLFDYYWYDDGPYLQRSLDEGFLGNPANSQLEFGIMWANHELVNIFPATERGGTPPRLKSGEIDRTAFEAMTDHVIANYFSRPNYLRIDGKPWFSVYEIGRLLAGLGGVEATREALESFERKTIAAGHPGLHLDCVIWGFGVLPEATTVTNSSELMTTLGFATATSYVWIHHSDSSDSPFPVGDWRSLGQLAFEDYEATARQFDVPVYPNVTVGWDSSPRTALDVEYKQDNYPWMPVWDGTVEDFTWGLERAKEFLAAHPSEHPIVTINAWNEWTEGSSLLPDTHRGTAYLDAVLNVFGHVCERAEN